MSRALYMMAEWAFVWLLTLAAGAVLLLWAAGVSELTVAIFVVYAAASAFLAGRTVLVGNRRRPNPLTGFYTPFRPLAAIAQGYLPEMTGAGRTMVAIGYQDPEGRDSIGIVRLLAEELDRLGVAHSNVGALCVTDGGTRWRVEPALDADRLEGWIEAEDPADRRQVLEGLRAFLTSDLQLTLDEEAS